MRYEEPEEIEGDEQNSVLSKMPKWLPSLILLGSVFGFVLLAYYSYQNGGKPVKDEDLLVVEADKTPMKEKPTDAGGMQFPNQDKTIYETFSNNPAPLAKVERVLPAPEEPMTSDEENSVSAVVAPEKPTEVAEVPVAEKTVSVAKEEPKPVPVIAAPKPAAVEKPAVASKKGVTIQLGAYPSDAEAKKDWARIKAKFSALSGKSPQIVKATVGGKEFYRLRVGGFADEKAAKSLCATLSAQKQGCILAK